MKPKSLINHRMFLAAAYVLSGSYAAAADYYFDVNGTDAGSGVVDGSSYAATGTFWSTGTGASAGTATPGTLPTRQGIVFSAGTDASALSYEITGTIGEISQGITVEEGHVTLNINANSGRFYLNQTVKTTASGTSLNFSGGIWDFYGKTVTFETAAGGPITLNSISTWSGRSGGVIKTGSGLLTVEGAASARGITVDVNDGEMRIRNSNAMWTSGYTSTVTVNGGTLSLDNNIAVANNPITINGSGFNNGSMDLGALANYAGNNAYNSLITLGSASRINNNAAGTTLTLNPASGNAVTGAFALTMGGAGNITVSKPIDATVTSLTKDGAGTLTLSGSNAFSGATTVTAGTLKLNGGSIGSSDVTVNGGTLASGSTGTVGNIVTVNSGATLAAGGIGSIGVASVASNLNFSSGSIFDWDLTTGPGNGIYDTVSVAGALNITSGAKFNVVSSTVFSDSFWNTAHTWSNIFGSKSINNFLTTNFLYSGSSTAPAAEGYFTVSGSNLIWTAVPEPTSALAGLLITAGLMRRRR